MKKTWYRDIPVQKAYIQTTILHRIQFKCLTKFIRVATIRVNCQKKKKKI